MARTKRSAVRSERAAERDEYDHDSAATTMSPKTYTIPQRSSSRAPSAAHMHFQDSDSTVHDDMQSEDRTTKDEEPMQSFGRRSRKLIEVIRNLEILGIHESLSSLPKFVVVGDQSHGKSSIIEAICGISLPRSSGTCTRCPFRITTTATRPGESWSCKIMLTSRFLIDRNGKLQDNKSENPVHFTTVTDRADLEGVLQLAQFAILNPHIDPTTVLRFGTSDTRALSFSYNAIDLHIAGHELPDLSMIDLPGSINVAPDESEQHLVGMIEKVIKGYVRDDKASILLVASMDQDLETSTAFRLIGNCKALGRSMGVLTKPDLLGKTQARFDYVRRILHGDVFKLGASWFVTKNASQEDLDSGMTHLEARKQEERFFHGAPWSSNLLDYEDRFGTKNLQNAISHRLVAHIESELPDIIARANSSLSDVSEQLDRMPERPTNPSQTVIEEVQRLVSTVVQRLQGDDDGAVFRTGFKALLRGYRNQIQNARPQVLCGTPGYVKPVHSLDSDDDTMSPTPSKRQKTNSGHSAISTPSKSTSYGASQDHVKYEEGSTPPKVVFTLDQIHAELDQARNSDLSDQIHPKVIERFIRQSNRSWPGLTAKLLESVQKFAADMLADCLTEILEARSRTALFTKVMQAMQAICNDIYAEETDHINHLIACEMYRPVTYAGGLKQSTEEVRTKLTDSRIAERLDEYFDTMEVEKNVKVPIGQKRKDKLKDAEFVSRALGPDSYASEVKAMAQPLAYYDLAANRLSDTVANHLEYGVVHAIETKLQVGLMLELRVSDKEYCAQLLAEDPEREAERQRLIEKHEKLTKAVQELQGLPGQH